MKMFLKTNNIIVYTSIYLSIRLSVCHQCLGLVFFTPVLVPEFPLWGSRGLMDRDLDLEIWTCNLRLWVRISGLAGIVFGGGVNNERSLHLRYHDWGETLEQGTEPPTAPRAPQHWLPTALGVCVCTHLDGLNAEHKFRVWLTILGHKSIFF